jgi:hypothetical protein
MKFLILALLAVILSGCFVGAALEAVDLVGRAAVGTVKMIDNAASKDWSSRSCVVEGERVDLEPNDCMKAGGLLEKN